MKSFSVLLLMIVALLPQSASAGVTGVAGKSLFDFKLGSSRAKIIAQASERWPAAKRQPVKFHPDGTVEEWWIIPMKGDVVRFEALSRQNTVVQLMVQSSIERYVTDRSFAQLLTGHDFQKTVYNFSDFGGGGYVGFYFDDVKRGVLRT